MLLGIHVTSQRTVVLITIVSRDICHFYSFCDYKPTLTQSALMLMMTLVLTVNELDSNSLLNYAILITFLLAGTILNLSHVKLSKILYFKVMVTLLNQQYRISTTGVS